MENNRIDISINVDVEVLLVFSKVFFGRREEMADEMHKKMPKFGKDYKKELENIFGELLDKYIQAL